MSMYSCIWRAPLWYGGALLGVLATSAFLTVVDVVVALAVDSYFVVSETAARPALLLDPAADAVVAGAAAQQG